MPEFRFLFAFILLFITSGHVFSQKPEQVASSEPRPKRWVMGGDFGLGFSDFGFNARVAPQIGYMLAQRWEAGVRLTYLYSNFKYLDLRYHFHDVGGGLYTSYDVYKGFFLHGENELLSYNKAFFNTAGITKDRVLVNSVFVGVGYRQYFGESSSTWIMLLYNLNETLDSPYSNPLFRIGFGIVL